MRILIDGITFQNQFQIGVQRLFRETLQRVGTTEQITIALSGRPAATLPANCKIVQANYASLATQGFDLFESTRFTRLDNPDIPEVVAIHDMIPECHWNFDSPEMAADIEAKRAAGAAAARITTLSHAAASDIVKVHPDWESKVRVVYPGADHLGAPSATAKPPGVSRRFWRRWRHAWHARRAAADLRGKPYALFVGDRAGYKNFSVILDAMESPQWDPQVQLALVGSPLSPTEAEKLRSRSLLHRITVLGRVNDDRLRDIYAEAQCFLFPSLAEGFGFPLLEAQVAGTWVVCSDTPVFREVGGDQPLFCDPKDPTAWSTAVMTCCKRPLNAQEQFAGRKNVDRFRWETSAAQKLQAYRQAIQEAPAAVGAGR